MASTISAVLNLRRVGDLLQPLAVHDADVPPCARISARLSSAWIATVTPARRTPSIRAMKVWVSGRSLRRDPDQREARGAVPLRDDEVPKTPRPSCGA